jgi:hypothetical protein
MDSMLRRIPRRVPAALAATWIAASFLATPHAAGDPGTATLERRVKAAFLYKFSGYVEWPATAFSRPESPIVIGVAGDDALANDLAQMTLGRTTSGHSITVVKVDRDERPRNLHILFVGGAESERIRDWADLIRGAPVLLVTDSEGALERGSMINFIPSEGRVRFEVAVSPALAGGIKLSSGLLAVAKSVVPAAQ